MSNVNDERRRALVKAGWRTPEMWAVDQAFHGITVAQRNREWAINRELEKEIEALKRKITELESTAFYVGILSMDLDSLGPLPSRTWPG